jgi:hypothetical protein
LVTPKEQSVTDFPVPGRRSFDVVVPAPGSGPQQWSGAPNAVLLADGTFVMSYRVRSNGDWVVIATSKDGVTFEKVATLENSHMGSSMTERAALVPLPDDRWRMYTSYATIGDQFWKIGMLEADSLPGLVTAEHHTIFHGDDNTQVKDPIVRFDGTTWHAWICCHQRDEINQWDGMYTAYATSADGLDWDWHGPVLTGREGMWDARGARITSVLPDGRVAYDGRRTPEENWFERTGLAVPDGDSGTLRSISDDPVSTARYLDVIPLPDGSYRLFYEQVLPDESHELRMELIPAKN